MLIIDGVKYSLYVPKDEKEFEGLVKEHFSEIFGKDSLYFDIKPELRSEAGIGSKPDAIVICLGEPSVYVIEYELKGHPIHDHVVAQISKFNKAFKSSETKLKLAGAVHSEVSSDLLRKALTESKVKGELFKFFTDLFSSKPKVVIIVDEATEELKEAVEDLPFESKIVEFKTFERNGVGLSVHAHLFEPLYSIIPSKMPEIKRGKREYPEHYLSWEKRLAWVDGSVREIVNALTYRILQLREATYELHGRYCCFYKGKPSTKSIFAAFLLGKHSLSIRIRTDPATFRDPQKWTGDRVYKGWFFKQGQEREFKITNKEQIDYAMELITQSYELAR
jgi:predicted transport protein